jgi:hypothetical protein
LHEFDAEIPVVDKSSVANGAIQNFAVPIVGHVPVPLDSPQIAVIRLRAFALLGDKVIALKYHITVHL